MSLNAFIFIVPPNVIRYSHCPVTYFITLEKYKHYNNSTKYLQVTHTYKIITVFINEKIKNT